MSWRIASFFVLSAFLLANIAAVFSNMGQYQQNNTTVASFKMILVPDNYAKIQSAINNASDGDIITIRSGRYVENIVVNKTVALIGDNADNTIIDGGGRQTVVKVNSDDVVISDLTLQHGYTGIWLDRSKNCRVIGNNVKNNAYGLRVDHSENATIKDNVISNSQWFGLELDSSGNSVLRNNKLFGRKYNFRVDGEHLSDFINDIDTSNTVNDLPIHYLINQQNLSLNVASLPGIGYLALINSSDILVKDLSIAFNGQGILLAYSSNATLSNLDLANNWNGIEVKSSKNITISENNANNNFDYGIKVRFSENCRILENNANNNNWGGISLFTSNNSIVSKNSVGNNYYGLHIVYSSSLIVTRNTVTNSDGYSIVLYYSNYNQVYHNNFVNSYIYPYVPTINSWNKDFEGNYWSSHNASDTDQDGIGDTPYTLEENNQDNFPLMGKFNAFEVASESFITTISNSTSPSLEFHPLTNTISLTIIGPNGTTGFCRVQIPKALLNDEPYIVTVNGNEPLELRELSHPNTESVYLYILFVHSNSQPAFPNGQFVTIFGLAILVCAIILAGVLVFFARKWRKSPKEEESPSFLKVRANKQDFIKRELPSKSLRGKATEQLNSKRNAYESG